MFKRKPLRCGKDAAQVAKLVAGPHVHICDACVAEASRIMNEPDRQAPAQPPLPKAVRRPFEWVTRWFWQRLQAGAA